MHHQCILTSHFFFAEDVSIGLQQTDYTVTEGLDPVATVCAITNIPLQRDGVVVTFSTMDGTALGMLHQGKLHGLCNISFLLSAHSWQ